MDFPTSADEIAEPRPDMSIKVAAFTVKRKFYQYSDILLKNTYLYITVCFAAITLVIVLAWFL